MKKSFKETVQAMTAKEIIMAMVEGLRNPVTEIDMAHFGRNYRGVRCTGCAATNTVCKIAGITLPELLSSTYDTPQRNVIENAGGDYGFVQRFEYAIDALRCGCIDAYNEMANNFSLRIARIKNNGQELPPLRNDYTEADLQAYVELANAQES